MKKRREPTSPGEILREEFLVPLAMTQKELADHLGCDVKVVNRMVNGRTSVSAEMALKLGAAFRTSPESLAECTEGQGSVSCAEQARQAPFPCAQGELNEACREPAPGPWRTLHGGRDTQLRCSAP